MTVNDMTARPTPILGVGAVIWNPRREIALIQRGKQPRLGQWSIPGGHLEWGETLHEAVLREIREETGLTVEIAGLIDAVDSLSRESNGETARHYVLIDYAARWLSGDLRAGTDARDARWVPLAQIGEYGLWEETRRVIDLCAQKFF